jgi:hypothetical protein
MTSSSRVCASISSSLIAAPPAMAAQNTPRVMPREGRHPVVPRGEAAQETKISEVSYMFPRAGADKTPACATRGARGRPVSADFFRLSTDLV